MGDLSKHFSRHEIACKCGCGFAAVDERLVDILEEVRQQFSRPVVINSGCRCRQHNQAVGGAVASYHLPDERGLGRAADIRVLKIPPEYVADCLEEKHPGGLGIGRYGWWTHVDVGPRRRWREPYTCVTET